MAEDDGSISDMVNRVLYKLVDLVDKYLVADFDPGPTIESLVPYLAPIGTQRGDPVPGESAVDEHHTKLAGAAVTVLASIIRKYYGATAQWPGILERLIAYWPSTCMGLLFYSRALLRLGDPPAMLEVDSPAHTFTSIVTLLQMYTDIEGLDTLLQDTPEVAGLIIRLWALEVQNPSLATQLQEMFPHSCPPTAARLLHRHLFMQKRDVLPVFAVEGSLVVAAIAGVGLEHIRRSISTLSRHTSAIPNMQLHLRNLMYLHSTHLHSLILSQNSVRVVTEALVALTSRPFDAANTGALTDCVTQIGVYLQTYITGGGLVGLNQSLEFGLLIGLMKSHPWLDPTKPEFGFFETLLAVQLPKYLIYISVLRQVHKSFNVAQQLGLMGAMPDVHRKLWMAFETCARARLKLATDVDLEMVACSNPQAGPFNYLDSTNR